MADGTVADGRKWQLVVDIGVSAPRQAQQLAAGHTAKVPVIRRRKGPALVSIDGSQAHRLSRPVMTVGRALDNDIILDDRRVSRHHARLAVSPAGMTVSDLGSANGTWVPGGGNARSA
jgi:pSer/pThr/pTyr-binding forkhead associated (FHA) protein